MAVSRPDLEINIVVGTQDSSIVVDDITGTYNPATNTGGYGLPEGPTVNNVTALRVILLNQSDGWYLTYSFTIDNGTITAATLGVSGATATSILSEMSSTAWPFITAVNAFDLTADYGVTIPTLSAGVYQATYTIVGTATGSLGTPEAFSYTTSEQPVLSYDLCCCIDNLFIEAAGCDCGCDKGDRAMKARYYLTLARYAANNGDTELATNNFEKASELCDGNCAGC